MKVSLLNEKILFQRSAVVSDAIGNRKNTWEDYYSCFATIGGESRNEKAEQAAPATTSAGNISVGNSNFLPICTCPRMTSKAP